jgi:parallel beta-helix repeat protein
LQDSINNTIINNTADSNTGNGIALQDSINNTIINNTVDSNTENGIALYKGSNNKLTNNTASNNFNGIYLYGVDGTKLSNNNASKNKDFGINVLYSNNDNKICNNTANSNGRYGISFYDSSNNTLSNNVISYNEIGIRLRVNLGTTSDNEIKSNIVLNNEQGIYISNSNSNLIYNNYFNNTDNVVFFGYDVGNIWNITKIESTNIVGGPYLGGNYWANSTGTGFSQINLDIDHDGFCDSQFDFAGNTDYLPLHLYEAPELTPIEKLETLNEYVDGLDEEVADSTKHVLDVKLDNVINKLDKGDDDKAIKKLEGFIKFVGIMERQDKLGDEQAEHIINEANRIIELIRNSEG